MDKTLEDTPAGDVAAIIDIAKETFVSEPIPVADGRQLVLASANLAAHWLPALNPELPQDIRGEVTFIDPQSLIDYANLYKSASALCFAYLAHLSFVVRLDYHTPLTVDPEMGASRVTMNQHTATLKTQFDKDYALWRDVFLGKRAFEQGVFAEFLQDMAHTIVDPDPAALREMILDLEIKRDVAFKQKINPRDGTTKLLYEETDRGAQVSGEIVLPNIVMVSLPVYEGTDDVDFPMQLRFVLEGGAVRFHAKVPSLARIELEEFRKIGDDIHNRVSIPVFYAA